MMSHGRVAFLSLVAVAFLWLALPGGVQTAGQQAAKSGTPSPNASKEPIPPYFKSVKAAKPLPHVLPASRFAGRPVVVRAYEVAGKIPEVLVQEPCYCGCDKHAGHHSLLDCYASDHTAGCAICVKEAFFVYEMTKLGKSPAQIREAIIRGDWKTVDINHPPEL
jgi:Protein of unknown function with PCYCGC motif